jgi:hypothetical protein
MSMSMSLAVSTTEGEATAARLAGRGAAEAPPDLSADDLEAFREALARASLGLFVDPATRGALTSEQHLGVCARAGREALEARRARRLADARADAPGEVP